MGGWAGGQSGREADLPTRPPAHPPISQTVEFSVLTERTERLGGHPFGEIAYGWHDLGALVTNSP